MQNSRGMGAGLVMVMTMMLFAVINAKKTNSSLVEKEKKRIDSDIQMSMNVFKEALPGTGEFSALMRVATAKCGTEYKKDYRALMRKLVPKDKHVVENGELHLVEYVTGCILKKIYVDKSGGPIPVLRDPVVNKRVKEYAKCVARQNKLAKGFFEPLGKNLLEKRACSPMAHHKTTT